MILGVSIIIADKELDLLRVNVLNNLINIQSDALFNLSNCELLLDYQQNNQFIYYNWNELHLMLMI